MEVAPFKPHLISLLICPRGFFDCAHCFCALIIISSAILLAFFQISVHNSTVGIEEVTLKISAVGVYPMRALKGVCLLFHRAMSYGQI